MARPRSRPSMRISPSLISRRPASTLRRVVLPQPEGPRRTRNSPSSTLRSRFSRTVTAPYLLTIWRNSTVDIVASALEGSRGDPLDEEPAEEEIDDKRRRRGQEGSRHQHVVRGAAGRGGVHVVEDDGHRPGRGLPERHADQEVVP